MGGSKVQVIAWPLLQPLADHRRLVGPEVIQHQMDIEIDGNDAVDLLQESRETPLSVRPDRPDGGGTRRS
jgi:hypothetical protein